ncbi:MAG TPA: DegV family protein [Anaerolineaceae bacterium]
MPKIAIITDTDSSLPGDLAARYAMRQVPIGIHFGDESYETNETIDDAGLFKRINALNRLPTTSAPSPQRFAEEYQRAFERDQVDAVVCLTVSQNISATYNNAVMARETLPELDITVINTNTVSMAQGFIVLAAARAAQAGLPKAEVIAAANDLASRVNLYGALSTLKYLAMSGRVGKLAAGMAGMLDIKPVLTSRDGKLEMLDKVRTRQKSWNRVIELSAALLEGGKRATEMAVIHANCPEDAALFCEQVRKSLPCPQEILIAEFTPGLSVHAGAGLVGLVTVTA